MAIATRMGKDNTKFIFCGDIKQNDINKKYVALNLFKEIVNGLPKTDQFEFTKEDNMRDPLVQALVERFEQMEQEGKITPNKKNA
jgi:phosphate starvation-inducible protein PhoH